MKIDPIALLVGIILGALAAYYTNKPFTNIDENLNTIPNAVWHSDTAYHYSIGDIQSGHGDAQNVGIGHERLYQPGDYPEHDIAKHNTAIGSEHRTQASVCGKCSEHCAAVKPKVCQPLGRSGI